ncbi:hypothetical protein HOP50_02g15140 [Chloropicon primus]|uniref:Uncharacterized protein n=1 Tax=Chloropicon primus TaxID=1764295 RepID=A0A5B8MEG2_9CHLO|nr:hypothetical protein A3770_02p15240 [Chloropicon primus]UPQ98214.1 hypothetical protein HOP50_02g15140 [Chloropicon primus]|eukprot:QDZ19006.1 hypothetical protein A3770_02p15240 [Chloropicon primus]
MLRLTNTRRARAEIARSTRCMLKAKQAYDLHSSLSRRGLSHSFVAIALSLVVIASCFDAVAATEGAPPRGVADNHRKLVPAGQVEVEGRLGLWKSAELKLAKERVGKLRMKAQGIMDRLEVKSVERIDFGPLVEEKLLSDILIMKDAIYGGPAVDHAPPVLD